MKKYLIAVAGLSAIAAAAPASAQGYPTYYPQHQGYGYPQGPAYGYNYSQQGLVRAYLIRADQLRQRIERLDSRDRISEREARGLRNAAIDLQNRTRSYARNGLSGRERYELDQRIARLEQAVRYQLADRNNRYGNGYGEGYGGGRDRDRDGRIDRFDDFIDRDRDGVDDRLERRRDRDDD
jgi:hypothetical protein